MSGIIVAKIKQLKMYNRSVVSDPRFFFILLLNEYNACTIVQDHKLHIKSEKFNENKPCSYCIEKGKFLTLKLLL